VNVAVSKSHFPKIPVYQDLARATAAYRPILPVLSAEMSRLGGLGVAHLRSHQRGELSIIIATKLQAPTILACSDCSPVDTGTQTFISVPDCSFDVIEIVPFTNLTRSCILMSPSP
jgi:hypothetical protein